MTLPDRVLAHLKANNGIAVDNGGKVASVIAEGLEEQDVARVEDALDVLQRAGCITRGGGRQFARKVQLTDKGWKIEAAIGARSNAPNAVPSSSSAGGGIAFEPITAEAFARLPHKGGRVGFGQKIVEAFLDTSDVYVRVIGLTTKPQSARASIDKYIREKALGKRIAVRVVDGALYLAKKEVAELQVAK